MPMTKDQREALLASVAKSVVEALENSSSFTYKVNSIATEAAQEAIDDLKDSIDLSVEDKVNEAVQSFIKKMDWSQVGEDIDLDDLLDQLHKRKFTINREFTYQLDPETFYSDFMPSNLEQLVVYMRFACEDVSFLEHAKRISRMAEILKSL
jgi:hypothetical protein